MTLNPTCLTFSNIIIIKGRLNLLIRRCEALAGNLHSESPMAIKSWQAIMHWATCSKYTVVNLVTLHGENVFFSAREAAVVTC